MVSTKNKKKLHQKNGKWKALNKHGILTAHGTYINGRKEGLWKEYYDSGELMIEEVYNNGVKHGSYATYHRNGELLSEGKYVNGQREGYFTIFDELGTPLKSFRYLNGSIVEDFEVTNDGEGYASNNKFQVDYTLILIVLLFWTLPFFEQIMK